MPSSYSTSDECNKNNHDKCSETIVEMIEHKKITRLCQCNCHDNFYKLIKASTYSSRIQD